MDSRISATEAARTFSELLNRVRFRGDTFVVERGGEPVCRIVPAGPAPRTVRDLADVLERAPRPDARYLDELEQLLNEQPAMPAEPWER